MLTFNTILRHENIEPKNVRLVRHQNNDAVLGRTPYDLWRAGDGRLVFSFFGLAAPDDEIGRLQHDVIGIVAASKDVAPSSPRAASTTAPSTVAATGSRRTEPLARPVVTRRSESRRIIFRCSGGLLHVCSQNRRERSPTVPSGSHIQPGLGLSGISEPAHC